MLRKFFKRKNNQKGQSLLEFALIIPIVSVIFMGIFDFGWMLHKQMTMDNAARAAARRGAVGIQTPELIQRMKDSVYFDLRDDQIEISILDPEHNDTGDNTNRTTDNIIVVEVTLTDVQLITPLKNLISSMGTINLNSRAEFLVE